MTTHETCPALSTLVDALEDLRSVQVRQHRTWPMTATDRDAGLTSNHEANEVLADAANLVAMGYPATAAVLVEGL